MRNRCRPPVSRPDLRQGSTDLLQARTKLQGRTQGTTVQSKTHVSHDRSVLKVGADYIVGSRYTVGAYHPRHSQFPLVQPGWCLDRTETGDGVARLSGVDLH